MEPGAVLLVNPRTGVASNARMPLSIVHLTAVLEGRWPWSLVDGNRLFDPIAAVLERLRARRHAMVGITVMPGPQVIPAIAMSAAIRAAAPEVPIVWGGYFPTLYPDAALNAPYVDYLVRGQGEETLVELLARLPDAGPPRPGSSARDAGEIRKVAGLTWKEDGRTFHNPDRPAIPPGALPVIPYDRIADMPEYMRPSFLSARTTVHQAALGCRYKCEFCGVVSMWNGKTLLEAPDRLLHALGTQKKNWGADGVQFFDHNFFDREESSLPILDVLGHLQMPWWCYARADALAGFGAASWEKIRKSRLRMAYIGAEAASDEALKRMHKGARVDHTIEVARRCREYGVIPEFSFVLGGPDDPEAEIEQTFEFVRKLKTLNPEAEIVLYFYSPTPQRRNSPVPRGSAAPRLPVLQSYGPAGPSLPTTPEEWTEPRWVRWVCHQDAPWLTPRIRRRVNDFARVVACRFPTVQDARISDTGRSVLRNLARWRYATRRYDNPWELRLARRLIRLREPQREGL
ncbi:MAG TPA: radical SAM protein [Polyangia bacterium]|nr:radical SAM protein [Polyangia bacterium]